MSDSLSLRYHYTIISLLLHYHYTHYAIITLSFHYHFTHYAIITLLHYHYTIISLSLQSLHCHYTIVISLILHYHYTIIISLSLRYHYRIRTGPLKPGNLIIQNSRLKKSWNLPLKKNMENYGKSSTIFVMPALF